MKDRAASAPASCAAAFFDVDGTLVRTTIVHYYAYFRRRLMNPRLYPLWRAAFLARCAGFLVLDRINRSWFNRVFYRSYRGLPAARIRALADDCYRAVMRPRQYAEGVDHVRRHRAEGRRVVLVTGSIDFLIAPLAADLGGVEVIAPDLVEASGVFTGELGCAPVGETEKARRVGEYASSHGVDLSASYAYGDSIADLPMLELVGHPVAVNPDAALAGQARRRGWTIETWTHNGRQEQRPA